eukprot:PhF_6_TR26638/c0_g1_i1/m.38583
MHRPLKKIHPRLASSPLVHTLPECSNLAQESTNNSNVLSTQDFIALQVLPEKDVRAVIRKKVRAVSAQDKRTTQAQIHKDRSLLTYRMIQSIDIAIYEANALAIHNEYGKEQKQRWDSMREEVKVEEKLQAEERREKWNRKYAKVVKDREKKKNVMH